MQKTKSEIWDENMGKFLKIVKWWKAVLDLKCRSDKREVWYQKKKKNLKHQDQKTNDISWKIFGTYHWQGLTSLI